MATAPQPTLPADSIGWCMPKKAQRGYSTTAEVHNALRTIAWSDRTTIAETLEAALLALISQRIAQKKQVSLDMLNLYLQSSGVQVVVQ